jgi:hypothetical protein
MWETDDRTSRKHKQRHGLRRFRFRLVCCSLLFGLAAGCESNFVTRQQGDPLLGIHAAPKSVESPSAPSNATAQATSGPIPPMPSSYAATGTAPVAGGETATSENPRNLRMAGDPVAPASVPSAGAARGAPPTVRVGNPEPAPTVGTTANLAASPVSSASAANIRTYEEAQQFLQQHRVTWQRMSQDDGEWKFACGIPNPSNPHVNKTYQTSKPFPDLLSAMRAVIAQIEQAPQ